jgi:hypothetical protein
MSRDQLFYPMPHALPVLSLLKDALCLQQSAIHNLNPALTPYPTIGELNNYDLLDLQWIARFPA